MSSLWTPGGERAVPREPPPEGQGEAAARSVRPESDRTVGTRPDGAPSTGPESPMSPAQQGELEEELAAMQAELAGTPASVVIANHAVGLFQLAAIHLNQRPPNLAEGRLAIDAMATLVEGLAGRLGGEEEALRDGLSQLRLAFVQLQDQRQD